MTAITTSDGKDPQETATPWDRQDSETARAFSAFIAYRDLEPGERRLRRAAEAAGCTYSSASKWSSKNHWRERVEAWDRDVARRYAEAAAEELRDMAQRHARVGQLSFIQAAQRLQDLDWDKLTPLEVLRWLEVSARLEAEARHLVAQATATISRSDEPLLDRLEHALMARAESGEIKAIEALMKVQERKAKATGSDAPERVAVGVEANLARLFGGRSPIEIPPEVRRAEAERLLAESKGIAKTEG